MASEQGRKSSLPWSWIAVILSISLIAIIVSKMAEPKSTLRQDAFVIGNQKFERTTLACGIDKANLDGRHAEGPCSKPWVSYDPHKNGRVLHVLVPTGICQTCAIDYRYAAPVGVDPRTTLYWKERLKISEPLADTEETFWCLRGVPECHAYINVKGVFWTLQIDRSENNPMALYKMAKLELEEMAK